MDIKLRFRFDQPNFLAVFHCIAPTVDVVELSLMAGKALSHYRVIEKIGGGMGVGTGPTLIFAQSLIEA
jgi:hypothetical protein